MGLKEPEGRRCLWAPGGSGLRLRGHMSRTPTRRSVRGRGQGAGGCQLTGCAAQAGAGMPTAPRTGSGCHRSVCRTDEPSLPSRQVRHMSAPPPALSPPRPGPAHGEPLHPASQPRPPPRGARAHMVCSRGFPRKAFSGMALMLLLWKPLGDNTGIRGTPGGCPTARQGRLLGRSRGPQGRPPGSATLGRASQCAGGGGEGREEQAQPPRRAHGGVQREGLPEETGAQGEAGLVSRP